MIGAGRPEPARSASDEHAMSDNPDPLVAVLTWSQVVPVVLIVGGAALLLWAIWRKPAKPVPVSPGAPAHPPAGAEQIHTVMRDAEELAGLLAGQIDRQAARLERLITEADARIRRLERIEAATPRPPTREPAVDPLNQQVYEMADEGLPAVDIARQLNQHTGKVELILALRQR